MYKDKDKQREAGKERSRRYRNKDKGVTIEGVTNVIPKGVTSEDHPVPDKLRFNVGEVSKPILLDVHPGKSKRGKDIKCFADLSDAAKHRVDNLVEAGLVRPTEVYGKLGDKNYNGVCTDAWRAERGR